FNTVIQATISTSIVGIIIFILKSTILRKLSAKWQYVLWSVMMIKVIFPKGPESKISIFNKVNIVNALNKAEYLPLSQNQSMLTLSENTTTIYNISEMIPYIWVTGVIVAIIWSVFSFIILKYKIYISSTIASNSTFEALDRCRNITQTKKHIGVVVQKHILITSLSGIIHPKILITEEFENRDINQMEYTFIHELSHYKRGDLFVNQILLFIQCIHWFNPIIWFLLKKIRQDMELATDEQTMLYIHPNEHKSYGMALINTLSLCTAKSPKLLGMANNKSDIKKRIKAISKFKKPNIIHNISGIITLVFTATICLTSAVVAKPISDTIYSNLPKIGITEIDDSTVKFGQQKNDHATEQQPVIEENKANELKKAEDILIIEDTNITTINYNTDYNGTYKVKVKPDSSGQIKLIIENKGSYNHTVKIGISNIKTIGYGWDYQFTTEGKTPIYLDGYDPDEEYFITIDCYCPGHYNINGTILIY
ncbi:MAG: M56 family metallopeptidase, partial [Clostridia bacterium]|nr:M56 family metallopeptidase [Clostridia bacterium]